MRGLWAGVFVAVCTACATGPVAAQPLDQQWEWCENEDDPDLAINGCTAIIQSGRETPANLAMAYKYRGSAYADRDENESAIRDLSMAIELDPEDAESYDLRGYAYRATGDDRRAAADFARARQIDPSLPPPDDD